MKIHTSINVFVLAALLTLLSLVCYAAERHTAPVSASIKATARVVASQGLAVFPSDLSFANVPGYHGRWLWITGDDNLQVQVTADGREVESRLVGGKSEKAALTVLERHYHSGLVRRQLQVESFPAGVSDCTITIVNTAN